MVSIELDGTVVFRVRCAAESVELVGAFGGWIDLRVAMRRVGDDLFEAVLDMGPGEHLFRYLADGTRWIVDDDAHGVVVAADGTRLSRIWRPPLRLEPDSIAA